MNSNEATSKHNLTTSASIWLSRPNTTFQQQRIHEQRNLQLYNAAAITAQTLSVLSGSKTQNQFLSLEKGTAIGDFVRRSYFRSTLAGQRNVWR